MKLKIVIPIALMAFSISCQTKTKTSPEKDVSPAASYRVEIENEKASALVSKMMEAMGGVEEWDDLKYVSWTFFGARHLVWDKANNRVRIETPRDSSIYLVNLDELEGKYAYNGLEITDSDIIISKIERAKSMWINDMYWLFMPFKLYDQGVTVKYVKEDTTAMGTMADVLELRFEDVGDTPQNKYEVYIDQNDNLIKQWDFFADANQEKASKVWPWDNYKDYNGLLLSANRSDKSGPSNVRVYDQLNDRVFTSFDFFEFY